MQTLPRFLQSPCDLACCTCVVPFDGCVCFWESSCSHNSVIILTLLKTFPDPPVGPARGLGTAVGQSGGEEENDMSAEQR